MDCAFSPVIGIFIESFPLLLLERWDKSGPFAEGKIKVLGSCSDPGLCSCWVPYIQNPSLN